MDDIRAAFARQGLYRSRDERVLAAPDPYDTWPPWGFHL